MSPLKEDMLKLSSFFLLMVKIYIFFFKLGKTKRILNLKLGVNMNTYALRDPSFTPLRTAVLHAQWGVVRLMLQSGRLDIDTLSGEYELYLREVQEEELADMVAKLLLRGH